MASVTGRNGMKSALQETKHGDQRWRCLRMEALENRLVLSICPYFPGDVSAGIYAVESSMYAGLAAADEAMPILGSSKELNATQLPSSQFIKDAGDKIATLNMGSIEDAAGLETALAQLLAPNTVTVTQLPQDVVDVEILLSGAATESTSQLALGTGLSGLPISMEAGGTVDFTIGYEYLLNFQYDCPNQTFTLTGDNLTGKGHELELSVGVSLSNFQATATIGFLESNISDNGSTLAATFAVDGLSVLPNVEPSVALSGSALLDLEVVAELGVGSGFPSIETDFVLDWPDLASAPTADLMNVEIGLGSYLTDTLEPIVDFVQPVLEPIQPVIEILNSPVPIITDLSELVGAGEVTLLDLVKLANQGVIPEGYKELVDLGIVLVQIADVVDMFDSSGSELMIELGDISINDLADGKDLRLLASANDPTTTPFGQVLQGEFDFGAFTGGIDLAGVQQQVEESDLPSGVKDGVVNLIERLQNGFNYYFPVLDDPVTVAVGLLMGKDVDLFKFDGQAIVTQAIAADLSFTLPFGLELGFGGGIGIDAVVHAGFDTWGLRKFLQSPTPDPLDILEGFYLTEDTHIEITGTISAHAGLDTMFFDAGVEGGVYASIGVNMIGLDTDGDGKVRRTIDNDFEFNTVGGLHAFLKAYVRIGVEVLGEFIGVTEEFTIADVPLWQFSSSQVRNPFIAIDTLYLAGGNAQTPEATPLGHPNELTVTEPNGVLTLNVGPLGSDRDAKANPGETSENYYIYSLIEDNEEVVVVTAFGVQQRFHGVQKIVADAGMDNDRIYIAEGVTVPVELHGGWGNDQLVYAGSGAALLFGDENDDLLVGGAGYNELYGGDHDDVLEGGIGDGEGQIMPMNRLFGGEGHDELRAGNGHQNRLYGENGDDTLFASAEGDSLLGGPGNDFIETGAGGDLVICGPGDDRVAWKVGSETAYIYGDGITLDLSAYDRGYDVVSVRGTGAEDTFHVNETYNGVGYGVQVLHGQTGTGVLLGQVEGVAIQAHYGADTLTVHDLANSSIEEVGLNLGDLVDFDYAEDIVLVEGTNANDIVTVELEEAALYWSATGGDLTLGGITAIKNQHYEVRTANVVDKVTLETYAGDDEVSVFSISGPTWIDTGDGGDVVGIWAETAQGEVKDGHSTYFATLDVEAGAGENLIGFVVDAAPQLLTESVYLTDDNLTAENLIPHGVDFAATGGIFGWNGIAVLLGTGAAADNVYIQNTLPTGLTAVVTHDGADAIVISSKRNGKGSLDTIEGPIIVDAGAGANMLHVGDRQATAGNAFVQVTSQTILGFAGPNDDIPIGYLATGGTYADIRLDASNDQAVSEAFRIDRPNGVLRLFGHKGDEIVDVEETVYPVEIRTGKGNDVVHVGRFNFFDPPLHRLDSILGPVFVHGGSGNDNLYLHDRDSSSGVTYGLIGQVLTRTNSASIAFKKMERVELGMTQHGDVVLAQKIPANTPVLLFDNGGDDYLLGPDVNSEWLLQGPDEGTVNGTLRFSAIEHMEGGAKKDRFVFLPGASVSGTVTGGGGNRDTLDYSAVSYDVEVDLSTNSAINIGAGVFSVEDVVGGSSDDILVGDAFNNRLYGGPGSDLLFGGGGNDRLYGQAGADALVGDHGKDRLYGGAGRDVLIGGNDIDRLFGEDDDDLLIGGRTSHDGNVSAVQRILAEWSRTDIGYEDRLDHLQHGGGLNGLFVLDSWTVFDDLAKDRLEGGLGRDWFFAKLGAPNKDKLVDLDVDLGEEVVAL